MKARKGGVLRRAGHTEAAIDLARLAGLYPVGVIVEIMNEDGSYGKIARAKEIAKKHQLKIVTIKDLIAFRIKNESLIEKQIDVNLPTEFGNFELHAFRQITNNQTHLALVKGKWEKMNLFLLECILRALQVIFLAHAVAIVCTIRSCYANGRKRR